MVEVSTNARGPSKWTCNDLVLAFKFQCSTSISGSTTAMITRAPHAAKKAHVDLAFAGGTGFIAKNATRSRPGHCAKITRNGWCLGFCLFQPTNHLPIPLLTLSIAAKSLLHKHAEALAWCHGCGVSCLCVAGIVVIELGLHCPDCTQIRRQDSAIAQLKATLGSSKTIGVEPLVVEGPAHPAVANLS